MSLTRTLASTARLSSLARPASLSLPHLLRPSSRSTFLSASAPATRSFSTSFVARERYSPVAGDPKWRSGKPVTYEELKPLTEQPDESVLILDVREPNEVVLGSIPSSVNLPLSQFEKGLGKDEGDFVKEFGWRRPAKTTPVVVYCKAGIRAQTAVDLLKAKGWKWARNYQGSYDDWVKKEQQSGNQDD